MYIKQIYNPIKDHHHIYINVSIICVNFVLLGFIGLILKNRKKKKEKKCYIGFDNATGANNKSSPYWWSYLIWPNPIQSQNKKKANLKRKKETIRYKRKRTLHSHCEGPLVTGSTHTWAPPNHFPTWLHCAPRNGKPNDVFSSPVTLLPDKTNPLTRRVYPVQHKVTNLPRTRPANISVFLTRFSVLRNYMYKTRRRVYLCSQFLNNIMHIFVYFFIYNYF